MNLEECEGYKTLMKAVKNDCAKGENCFNIEGCDKQAHRHENGHCYATIKCFHQFCNKFKWVLERVKHYSEKTGVPAVEILNSWEKRRDYWYMNYYQDSRQPLIQGDKVRVFDTIKEFEDSIQDKGFRCPKSKHVSKMATRCTSGKCDWTAGGLFGTMGKGVTVFIKENLALAEIFMPVAWEKKNG